MHPHLFTLPWGTEVNAYGTLIMLGGLCCLPMTVWDAGQRGIPPERRLSFLVDLWLVIVVGAFFGGRLLHVLTVPGVYAEHPSKLFAIDSTGFVFFGSLLAIAGGWIWVARRYGLHVGAVWDMGLTWVPLGHAAGRLGCFLAGCCWGGVHTGGAGVRFGPDSLAVLTAGAPVVGGGVTLTTLPLHPTQLYEAFGLLALLGMNWAIRVRVGVERPWRMASRYAVGYGALRALVEVFRGDGSRGFLFEFTAPALSRVLALPPEHPVLLSISQVAALGMIALGAWGLWKTRQRPETEA